MAITPYEKLNAFDDSVTKRLEERSKSTNLVETRTPFLRYTTGAQISELATTKDKKQYTNYELDTTNYTGCNFFTLGIQGWNNDRYSENDIYGSQGLGNGLIVGITYKTGTSGQAGSQVLVRAKNTIKNTNNNSYPPPGITSATIERLRSGNVLKFKIEAVCHTQQQLELLDIAAFAPGMTCILEWGTTISTSAGKTNNLSTILDFTKSVDIIKEQLKPTSRKEIVETWCKPNNYEYDFAVAHIANVKTVLENNVYKITVTAYGIADNILYISAMQTTTLTTKDSATNISTSVADYFKMGGTFTEKLANIINDPNHSDYNKIIRFGDAASANNEPGGATSAGQENALGFEDTYFISLDVFINFLNTDLMRILNKATGNNKGITQILVPLVPVEVDGDKDNKDNKITFGWNKYLRSTDVSTMILNNETAINEAKNSLKNTNITRSMTNDFDKLAGFFTKVTSEQKKNQELDLKNNVTPKLDKTKVLVDGAQSDADSGVMYADSGILLNSKMIQDVFSHASSIPGALDEMLRRMNSATEGYWDLKLFWDDEVSPPTFRILDDNLRIAATYTTKVYEFNKLLNEDTKELIGPEVINVSVQTDYPKILYSQLAISSLSQGTISLPNQADFMYRVVNRGSNPKQNNGIQFRGHNLPDIFRDDAVSPADPKLPTLPAATTMALTTLADSRITQLGDDPRVMAGPISEFAKNIIGETALKNSVELRQILTIFSDNGYDRLLSPLQIKQIELLIKSMGEKVTVEVKTKLLQFLQKRLIDIITASKTAETKRFKDAWNTIQPIEQTTDIRVRKGSRAVMIIGPDAPQDIGDITKNTEGEKNVRQEIENSKKSLIAKVNVYTITAVSSPPSK